MIKNFPDIPQGKIKRDINKAYIIQPDIFWYKTIKTCSQKQLLPNLRRIIKNTQIIRYTKIAFHHKAKTTKGIAINIKMIMPELNIPQF